jgi:hypothetical protein
LGAKKGIETALCQRITEGESKKGLANLWIRKKITKEAHAGRGLETIWEIPVNMHPDHWPAIPASKQLNILYE